MFSICFNFGRMINGLSKRTTFQYGTTILLVFVFSAYLLKYSTVEKLLVKSHIIADVLKWPHTMTYVDTKHVWIFNASNENKQTRDTVAKNKCVPMNTLWRKTMICVHPPERDYALSVGLIKTGLWERDLINRVAHYLSQHPGMTLLDLGCNIGAFTVYFAAMGRRVVSVDANKENLLLLTRSLNMDNLIDKVTLLWNAMSDVRENVTLVANEKNQGGVYVQPKEKTDTTETVRSTTLDDLVPLFRKDESIFIKMDIESYEWKALNGGWNFFKQMKVRYVMMEFHLHKTHESGNKICTFMTSFGFRPYKAEGFYSPLNIADHKNWPQNIFWIKE